MKYRKVSIIVFSLFLALSSFSQDLEETVGLGDHYFQSGQVSEALYTYQRAAFYNPDGAESGLLLKIAECFNLLGDFERSVEYLDHAYFSGPDENTKTEILFKKANSFIQTGNYHFALIELLGMDAEEGSLADRRKSLYLGSCYYGLEEFANAEEQFINAIPENDQGSRFDIQNIFSRKSNFFRPNPKAALWMSVFIPGSGQFYSGDIAAGINSLLLTGSFVALTFYLTSIYHPIDAILTALPWFQRYYQGGFDQAQNIAEKRRARKRKLVYNNILDIISIANKEN